MARRYRNFAVLSAYVGTGKTYALKHYAKSSPNVYLIEADPTMTEATMTHLQGLASKKLKDRFQGKVPAKWEEVTQALAEA